MSKPAVSVVLPVFNAGKYLVSAIGSIIGQTYCDWEMICINDGSTDRSPEILDWFAKKDPRIRVVHQSNAGVVAAANRGHALVQTEFVCRMDADDIAMPNRISHQVDFLCRHPDHVAVSGTILEIDTDSEPLGLQTLPPDHDTIVRRLLLRETGLFQPASIMRTDAFKKIGGFREKYQWIEDHDLWLRMSRVGQLGNTQELVLCYRLHASSCTWSMSNLRSKLMTQLICEAQAERGVQEIGREANTPPPRSFAGPGKWARKAIRGGYPRTALKHLRSLWKEEGLSWYTLRMFAEIGLRLPGAAAIHRNAPSSIQVPKIQVWDELSALVG